MPTDRGPSRRRPAKPKQTGTAPITPGQTKSEQRTPKQTKAQLTRQQNIDWETVRHAVHRLMTGHPPSSSNPTDRRKEPAREGNSVEDAISEAFRQLFETLDDSAPKTTKEAICHVHEGAKRFLNTSRRRISRRNKLHEEIRAEAILDLTSPGKPFTEEECLDLLTQLYDALQPDPEAQQLIYALLECDILWHQNKLLAAELRYTSASQIVTIKKRIQTKKKQIMAQFPRRDDEGDSE